MSEQLYTVDWGKLQSVLLKRPHTSTNRVSKIAVRDDGRIQFTEYPNFPSLAKCAGPVDLDTLGLQVLSTNRS